MKIAFVNTEAESYAIMLFSSLLKAKGHEVNLVFDPRLFDTDEVSSNRLARFFDIRKQNIEKLKRIKPDLIGFSTYTQDYRWNVDFARMIKKYMQIPIIFGGIHCTLCPDEVIKEDCIDIVCVGEGEHAIVELVEREVTLERPIRNLWYKSRRNKLRPLIQDLDSLPLPDKDLFYEQKPIFKKGYTISTGRGCPYSCTFCASAGLREVYKEYGLGNSVRQRSVGGIIGELVAAQLCYKPKTVYFTDDNLTMNVKWLREFAPIYRKTVGLPFYCTANPGHIKDEELELLKEAGCQMIGFGLQSTCEDTRVKILNRRGSNERIRQVSSMCRTLNINYSYDYIFSIPMDKAPQLDALTFFTKTRPSVINTFTMTYLPGTKMIKHLQPSEREEVIKGGSITSMFNKSNDCFVSMFALMPLLPKWVNSILITTQLYKFLKLPFFIRLFLKDLKRLMIGRWSDVFFPPSLWLRNMWDNFKIKWVLK